MRASTGIRFTCTSKRFMKMLMQVSRSPVNGSPACSIRTILPSAGLRAQCPSCGQTRSGSRKKWLDSQSTSKKARAGNQSPRRANRSALNAMRARNGRPSLQMPVLGCFMGMSPCVEASLRGQGASPSQATRVTGTKCPSRAASECRRRHSGLFSQGISRP
jgi:hypothetical protein